MFKLPFGGLGFPVGGPAERPAPTEPLVKAKPSRSGEEQSRWLIRIAKWAVYAVALLIPFLYLPVTQDFLFVKVVLAELAAVVAVAAWLLNVLVAKRISYKRSPLNAAFLALALILLVATFASHSPWAGFWGDDPTGEKVLTLLAFIAISFVAASLFERGDVERVSELLLVSFLILGLFTFFCVIIAAHYSWQLPVWLAANLVGTVNALAYVLAAGFLYSFVTALSQQASTGEILLRRRVRWLTTAASALLFLDLVLIGFRLAWIAIAVVVAAVIAFNFAKSWRPMPFLLLGDSRGKRGTGGHLLSYAAVGIAFLVLLLSLLFVFNLVPTGGFFQPPLEVSPSFRSTLSIAWQSLKANPLLGAGPANFRFAFSRFRDVALNSTAFWTIRFNHGFSFLATSLATVGALGFLALLAFVGVAAAVIGRVLWKAREGNPYLLALAAGALFVLLMWFLYASNFTASFLLFLFLGMFSALAQEPRAGGVAEGESGWLRSWWRVTRRTVVVDAPALNFAVSIVVVFASALSLVSLYALASQYAAEIYFNRAAQVLNRYGNVDTAKVFLGKAAALNSTDDGYFQGQAQVATLAVRRIIAQAAATPKQDLSSQFRSELSDGVAAGQRATTLAPSDPDSWFSLGFLYENVMPFVPGADRAALDAYQRARDADPKNPTIALAQGRVYLTASDILTLQINQTASGDERSRLEQIRSDIYGKAREALESAIALKDDYADAHFLAAQLAIRQNNVPEAIRKTEDTARLAPNDVGVAFQLGFLYYRAESLDKAKVQFERAVALNDNYSNARYFLGLIYDRRGQRGAALVQFERVAALNPDNDEVRRIVANLQAGSAALSGIVPPAPAPEARQGAPVTEGQGGAGNALKKK